MAHEHPIDDDEVVQAVPAPVDTPPVPGAPPGLDEDGPAGEPPVSPAVMAPE